MTTVSRSSKPVDADALDGFDHETDVLVIGFGGAGACAAIEAAEAGAQVIAVEGASGPGGSTAQSGGEIYLGGGTPTQKACGFDDTADDMFAFLQAALGPHADETKLRAYCDGSLDHYHWLVDHGVEFRPTLWDSPTWMPLTEDGLMWLGENSHPFDEIATPAPRGHRPPMAAFAGMLLMERLVATATEAGTDVHTDTTATRLVLDGGRVVGVIARRFGDLVTYRARRGVVLTTGGFVDDEQMLAEHAPQLLGHGKVSDGRDDGSGIRMGAAVGGALRRMGTVQTALSLVPGLTARGIVVNALGQRFINEDTYPGLISEAGVHHQPNPIWMIIDEAGYEEVPEIDRMGMVPTFVDDDVAALEAATGIPPGGLAASLDTYNRFADELGTDPHFHKADRWVRPLRGPLAAIDTRLGFAGAEGVPPSESTGASGFTLGGLRTTLDGEVLDVDGEAIPGLYAAGRASAGIHGERYISGTSIGDGTFFGRRAGRAAARA
jgi:3-oxo-5alpha-steroid 4-dehydrogenase